MRIDRLTVANFRGFHEECCIPFDANVVILRGPNGSGKTSLIDAVQWLLLGDVPRLRSNVLKKDEDYISNRYASGPPFVEGDLVSSQGKVRVSRRGLGKAMQVQVDRHDDKLVGEPAQDWLNQAIGGSGNAKHAEMLRRYLLQQDEMREFLGADTNDRYEFVAALTGMEQLTQLDSQMTEELAALRKGTREFEGKVKEAEGELGSVKESTSDAREMLDQRRSLQIEPQGVAERARDALGTEIPGTAKGSELLDSIENRSSAIEAQLEQLVEFERRELRARERLKGAPKESLAALPRVIEQVEAQAASEKNLSDELSSAEQALREAEIRANKAEKLAALALEQIDGPCPVCGQEHHLESTRKRLDEMLGQAPGLFDLIQSVDRQRRRLADSRKERADLESKLTSLNRIAEERAQVEGVLDQVVDLRRIAREQLLSLISPGSGAASDLELPVRAESFKQTIDSVARDLRRVLDTELRVGQASKRARTLDQQVTHREERLGELQGKLSAQKRRVSRAVRARRSLGEKLIEVTGEVANTSTSLINEIYLRLDVHPTFREFRFHTQRHRESGHLRPWVYDRRRGEDGNALNVLSAAQLNALAICLFLALNLERDTPLRTAILDDPVQSLDDVNLLSLADVLRTVRGRRQVVVSTHDETLAELLMRKLRPLRGSDSTMVVTLDQWSEAGPRVSAERRDSPTLEPELELLRDASA